MGSPGFLTSQYLIGYCYLGFFLPKPTKAPAGSGATINVSPGSGSETVCNQLKAAGVITSVSDFNSFLCAHGYDRKLTTGSHTIPAGASYEEIAKILMRKN